MTVEKGATGTIEATLADATVTPPKDVPRRRRSAMVNVLFSIVFIVLAMGWFVFLRPVQLGGSTDYVVVRGTSMLPTYRGGDLVLARARPSYDVGDVIAYEVPAGEPGAGLTVIHRIVAGSSTTGFTTQGDNNPAPDDWRPMPADIRGVPWVRIPDGGSALFWLRSPATIAALASSFAVVIVLFPPRLRRRRPEPSSDRPDQRPRLAIVAVLGRHDGGRRR